MNKAYPIHQYPVGTIVDLRSFKRSSIGVIIYKTEDKVYVYRPNFGLVIYYNEKVSIRATINDYFDLIDHNENNTIYVGLISINSVTVGAYVEAIVNINKDKVIYTHYDRFNLSNKVKYLINIFMIKYNLGIT